MAMRLVPPPKRPRRGLTEVDKLLWQAWTAHAQVAPMPGKALAPPPPAEQPVAIPAAIPIAMLK